MEVAIRDWISATFPSLRASVVFTMISMLPLGALATSSVTSESVARKAGCLPPSKSDVPSAFRR